MLPIANSSYFHDLLNSFSAGVLIVNRNGLVYAVNETAAALLGYSGQELTDPAVSPALIARTDRPRAVRHFLAAPLRHAQKPTPVTVRYAHPDGDNRHFRLSGSLLVENEKIFGILFEINDITEIVRLYDRERTMLLGIQTAQRERIESLDRFSLAVAHQIRNPLMVIGGYSGRLLRGRAADAPETPALEMILDGAKRLESVVLAVSDYTHRRVPKPETVDPAAVTRRAMGTAQARTGLAAMLLLDAAIGHITVDTTLLEQILVELLANALEAIATPAARDANHGALRVCFCRTAGNIRVTVADQGPGVPEDIRPFLFDPFFTTKAVGVGMGLAIAKRNAEELGGTLTLTPATAGPGGCLVELRLPDPQPGT